MIRRRPALSVKRRERDAAPPQSRIADGRSGFHAHHDGGILFDFADLAEFDVVAESAHQRWLHAGAAKIAGAETREEEKQRAANRDGAESYADGGRGKRSCEPLLLRGTHDCYRCGPATTAAQLHPDKCGDGEQEKDKKHYEEECVDRQNGCGEDSGESENRKKERVA